MKLRVLAAGLILGVMMTGGVTQAATKDGQKVVAIDAGHQLRGNIRDIGKSKRTW